MQKCGSTHKYKFEQMNSNTKGYLLYSFLYIKFKKRQNQSVVEMGQWLYPCGKKGCSNQKGVRGSCWGDGVRDSVPCSGCERHCVYYFVNTWAVHSWGLHFSLCMLYFNKSFKKYKKKIWNINAKMTMLSDHDTFFQ